MLKDPKIHPVLLIEDNPADARLVKHYLDHNEIIQTSLTHVNDIKSALDALQLQEYSIILLDLSLPDSFGLETLQKLRKGLPGKTLNIIVLTGNIDKRIGIDSIRSGAQDFLVKGNIDADMLGKSIRFAIERVQTYRFLEETQRSAKLGSWRYLVETDVFEISDIVYDLLSIGSVSISSLKQAHEISAHKFSIFKDFVDKHKDEAAAQEDFNIRLENGEQKYLTLKSVRNISIDNQIQLAGTIQDITERVMADELVKEAEFNKRALELKERFIANVSHEMRTPMNVILGLSRLLLDTKLSDVQLMYLNSIIHSGDMLLGIVNDILEISSFQQGTLELQNQKVDIRSIIQSIETQMMPKVNEKSLDASFQVTNEVPERLLIDQLRLQQILMNLIGNAVKFTDRGSITVLVSYSLNDNQGYLFIKIEDTGIGMPSDKLDVIFEPFVRIISKEKLHEGTGLGLTIVKTWIDKMQGTIHVQSKPGIGTEFVISIPVKSCEEEDLLPTLVERNLRKSTGKIKIMLVDDHALNRLVAQKTLEQHFNSCQIIVAENGQQALEKLELELPDIVLMDLQMPIMDGYEATWMIRKSKNPDIAALPILAMTANAYITKDTELHNKGFTDYILKPFNVENLIEKINNYCTL